MSVEHHEVTAKFLWLPKPLYDGRLHWLKEVYTMDGNRYFPFRSHLDAACAQHNSQVDVLNQLHRICEQDSKRIALHNLGIDLERKYKFNYWYC